MCASKCHQLVQSLSKDPMRALVLILSVQPYSDRDVLEIWKVLREKLAHVSNLLAVCVTAVTLYTYPYFSLGTSGKS